MCDENDLKAWLKAGKHPLSRRQFAGLGALGAASLGAAPYAANACISEGEPDGLAESKISYATADGIQDGQFIRPEDSAHTAYPAVIFWPDIAGIRLANRIMARRLADRGYAVLMLNPYYRDVAGQPFESFADFIASEGFTKVKPWRARFTPEAIMRDARAAARWLGEQSAVKPGTKIGAQGYCMTGSFALYAAKAAPELIGAAASFHGGGLVGADDAPDDTAPISALAVPGAAFLIAIAQNDDARSPQDQIALSRAAQKSGSAAEITVYPADHGWTVPDSPSYNQAEAERAFQRLLATYKARLT